MSLKYPEARGGFVHYHPPPENKKPFDGFNSNIRQKAWTYYHPPPLNRQFDF